MRFIDSHLHLWDLKQKLNSWVVKSNDPYLMQNFTLNELMDFYAKEHSLAGFITIEAADGDKTLDEVKWLSGLSKSLPSNILHKHIAYINTSQNPEQFNKELAKFKQFDFVAGFRDICTYSENSSYSPCVNDITLDEKKMLNLFANLKTLEKHGYIYNCQMYSDQLLRIYPLIIESKVKTVIDHCGLPLLTTNEEFITWQVMLDKYTQSNVIFKLSGLEMNDNWENRSKIIDLLCDKISSSKLIYGSNFPLVKQHWLSELSQLVEVNNYAPVAVEQIFLDNVIKLFHF